MSDILVIDDNLQDRTFITRTLTDVGHRVQHAKDGAKGLTLCRRMHPTLVITPIVMPEMDGIEVIRELSHEMPELPVLAIAGVTKASLYLRAARVLGATAALRKPFTADELLAAIAPLLGAATRTAREPEPVNPATWSLSSAG